MQEQFADSLLRSGIIEAKAGDKEAARRYLRRAISMSASSSHETAAEAWFWMADVASDPAEKREALENVLAYDFGHARARRLLAILEGRIKPEDIIDPDSLPPAPTGLVQADLQRFMCPKCGGRMSFAPDGQSLVCEYCTRRETLDDASRKPGEGDFLVAMATARGHRKPMVEQVFRCQGCGALFLLPPALISANCPYCRSPHVVSLSSSPDLIAPDAVLPHAFDQERACSYLARWLKQHKIELDGDPALPRGLYLPAWLFDLGGAVTYTAEIRIPETRDPERPPRIERVRNDYPLHAEDVPIPGSHSLAKLLTRLLPAFDLGRLRPFDSRYLSDWPAEIYDISLGDASLDARAQVLHRLRKDLPGVLDLTNIISTSTSGVIIESFRLVLLPVWVTHARFQEKDGALLIDGQAGQIATDLLEKKGLLGWLADLLET